jgi:hypothetical protein
MSGFSRIDRFVGEEDQSANLYISATISVAGRATSSISVHYIFPIVSYNEILEICGRHSHQKKLKMWLRENS